MTHQRTAEELREHAAVAVAKVRTEIHRAFQHGTRQGFSRAHIREALLGKGYRSNDIEYVEQLLDGTQLHQRKMPFTPSPILIAVVFLIIIGFLAFQALQANTQERALEAQTNAFEAAKIQDAKDMAAQLRQQQQALAGIAAQLAAFPSLSANLAPADRDALLRAHAGELQRAAAQMGENVNILDERLTEIAQVNAER